MSSLNEGPVQLATSSVSGDVTVSSVLAGYDTSNIYIEPGYRAPSAPQNVQLSVVGNADLGVYWEYPATDGGKEVTKFLIEWDTDYTMTRTAYSPSRSYAVAGEFAAVMNATRSDRYSDKVAYQFQIVELDPENSYDVRVSAYNEEGYSVAAVTGPKEAIPAVVPLWIPTSISMNTSHLDIPNRIDLTFQEPKIDSLGFDTKNDGTYTGNTADFYRIEWSEDASFDEPAGTYDWRAKQGNNEPMLCEGDCYVELGAEVQVLSVYSGNGEPLDGGGFQLLYVGPTSPSMSVLVEAGKTGITVLYNDSSITREYEKTPVVSAGDFLRIDGDLYEIAEGGASDKYNITLAEAYKGSGGDGKTILTAYYGALPSTCALYNDTANEMQTYIKNQLFDDVPFAETIKVSSENMTDGTKWRITFEGAAFLDDVYPLEVVSRLGPHFSDRCSAFSTNGGVTTTVAQTTVETAIDAGSVKAGTPYFVRVAAINDAGLGEYDLAIPSSNGADGALAARAKPGLPTDVKVYTVTDDDDALKVTWMPVDTDNGGVVTKYTVERTVSNDRDSWNDPNTGEDIGKFTSRPVAPPHASDRTRLHPTRRHITPHHHVHQPPRRHDLHNGHRGPVQDADLHHPGPQHLRNVHGARARLERPRCLAAGLVQAPRSLRRPGCLRGGGRHRHCRGRAGGHPHLRAGS